MQKLLCIVGNGVEFIDILSQLLVFSDSIDVEIIKNGSNKSIKIMLITFNNHQDAMKLSIKSI